MAHQIGSLPPVSSLFAAVLGVNPLGHLLAAHGVLSSLPAAAQQTITGREFFPDLISGPFQDGLVVVFALAAGLTVLAALASALRGARPVPPPDQAKEPGPGQQPHSGQQPDPTKMPGPNRRPGGPGHVPGPGHAPRQGHAPGPGQAGQVDYQAVAEQAGQAAAQGIAPGSPEGNAVLDRIVAPGTPAAQRARLLEQLETFTDARVERYWQLLAIINGQPVQPSVVPGFEWLIAALRAGLS